MLKGREEVQKQVMGFASPDSVHDRARAHIQSPREIPFLVGPRGQDGHLLAFGHPKELLDRRQGFLFFRRRLYRLNATWRAKR